MSFVKYASFDAEILDIKGSPARSYTASLDKLSDYDNYRTSDGYMYIRLRAISSRVNKNHDGWPSVELAGSKDIFDRHLSASSFTVEAAEGNKKYGFATFVGKPFFVDHHNGNPKKARGVIVDSKFNVLDHKTAAQHDSYWGGSEVDHEHLPPAEVELLVEFDAKSFPKLAKEIEAGDIDGFSMGCDVEYSKCSHCGNVAHTPEEFCSHIMMKGAHHDFKTADGHRHSKKSYENCYGITFFEISAVFDPADETALAREVIATVHTAENPLPQEMMTRAPDEIDTLREEKICPICGNDMDSETCDVCGFVEPPKEFDNPDLTKAMEMRERMKQEEEQQALGEQPPSTQGELSGAPGQQPGGPISGPMGGGMGAGMGGSPMPTKSPVAASVTSDMPHWTPNVHPKTAARINQVEKPVTTVKRPGTDEPTGAIVTSDQTTPVTSAMLNAQTLMARAQRNHQGVSMSQRYADGPTPPGVDFGQRSEVTGVGGFMDASNEEASKPGSTTEVTGIGGVGLEDVGADSSSSLPTAGRDSDDSGFNTDKTTEDSGPTKTFGDSDGSERAFTDPVTSQPFPASEDGVKKTTGGRHGYNDGTLEDGYGDPASGGGSANKGVQPVAESFGDRVDVLQPLTSPSNNSGKTDTWSGTDGNGVLRQQDPVTNESQEWGGVKVPDVTLHTRAHWIAAQRCAEAEDELGLLPEGQSKFDRQQELMETHPLVVQTTLSNLSRVKQAGLAKLASQRTAGVRRLPSAFGKNTAAPNGFRRIASDSDPSQEQIPLTETQLDSLLFVK